jgi:hypothetical protein
MTYLLGVDGGNTKSIALVARPDGAIAGAGEKKVRGGLRPPHLPTLIWPYNGSLEPG